MSQDLELHIDRDGFLALDWLKMRGSSGILWLFPREEARGRGSTSENMSLGKYSSALELG